MFQPQETTNIFCEQFILSRVNNPKYNKYKENIFFLKYEDIIINPKSTLIKIFDFCNLNYDNIDLPEVINKDKLYTYKLKEVKFDSEKYSKKLEKYGYNNEN